MQDERFERGGLKSVQQRLAKKSIPKKAGVKAPIKAAVN